MPVTKRQGQRQRRRRSSLNGLDLSGFFLYSGKSDLEIFSGFIPDYQNLSPPDKHGSELNVEGKTGDIDESRTEEPFFTEAAALIDACAPDQDNGLHDETAALIATVLGAYKADQSEIIRKLRAVIAGRMITAKKFERELPELPEGLSYPSLRFADSEYAGRNHGIIDFMDEVWKPLIKTGLIHRGHLALVDPVAAEALKRYLYNHGGPRRTLPDAISIPPQRNRHSKLSAE